MNYGLPYKGSKSKICDFLFSNFPASHTFVDVFSGGCSVTHKCILERKYKNYIINDLAKGFSELFIDSLCNKNKNFVFADRETFFREKDRNRFISLSFSFGNDNSSYIYSEESCEYRLACHNVIVNNDFSLFEELCPEIYSYVLENYRSISGNKRMGLGKLIFESLKSLHLQKSSNTLYKQYLPYINGKVGVHISPCYHLEKQERILSLYNPDLLKDINYELTHKSYEKLDIPDGSVVYCDPPYFNTVNSYGNSLIYSEFLDWCFEQSKRNYVFISEYDLSDHRFICIGEKKKRVNSSAISTSIKMEKLFVAKKY